MGSVMRWPPGIQKYLTSCEIEIAHRASSSGVPDSGPATRDEMLAGLVYIPSADLRPLYLFLIVTSVTPAASATSLWVLSSPSRVHET